MPQNKLYHAYTTPYVTTEWKDKYIFNEKKQKYQINWKKRHSKLVFNNQRKQNIYM